jgi:L-ascorbate metabolism protein UlaG (beta-lactamase superfamily)
MVTMVAASHSSSLSGRDGSVYAGPEAGYMIAGEGHVIYVSGDTDIMADMGWMGGEEIFRLQNRYYLPLQNFSTAGSDGR